MSDPKYLQKGFGPQLAHFVEECGEALAAAGKTQRWGPFSYNPEISPNLREPNLRWLQREVKDVQEAATRLLGTIRVEFGE